MIVMEIYRGSGRPTGRVCLGWYVGEHCGHSDTTWAEVETEEAAWSAYLAGEHYEIGHAAPVDGCPTCEMAATNARTATENRSA